MSELAALLGLELPARHLQALSDPSDPIHDACDFLVLSTKYELLDIVKANHFLHHETPYDP